MQKNIVPELPKKPIVITADLKAELQKWVDYIKAISPHILVKSILDPDFIPAKLLGNIQNSLAEQNNCDSIEIMNLQAEELLIIVGIPESLIPDHKKYLTKDSHLFCIYDQAFDVHYSFEEANDGEYKHRLKEDAKNEHDYEYYKQGIIIFDSWDKELTMIVNIFNELVKEIPEFKPK